MLDAFQEGRGTDGIGATDTQPSTSSVSSRIYLNKRLLYHSRYFHRLRVFKIVFHFRTNRAQGTR